MTVSSFCPGHVSCVFQPLSSHMPLGSGSRGLGIRLSLGSRATVTERSDDVVDIRIDGHSSSAHITRMTVQTLAPGRGFDIEIENDLPMSQGFGTSASGAIAAGVCVADIVGASRTEAFEAAHIAEVMGGGGLGDVAAIVAGGEVPVRTRAGFPPRGLVENPRVSPGRLTLAVLGPMIKTDSVIGSPDMVKRIRDVGEAALERFLGDPTLDNLYTVSNMFSTGAELESPAVRRAIEKLCSRGYRAGMCMLGNSIFTDAPLDEVRSMLGRGNVRAFGCESSSREIRITRRA
ncbi:MAG: pantothenate kinase [Candidatus Methanomethylophilaceae archaeon]|nr:pantothenate kinase [Candidatus Methanomethylophilaceae archaeon]